MTHLARLKRQMERNKGRSRHAAMADAVGAVFSATAVVDYLHRLLWPATGDRPAVLSAREASAVDSSPTTCQWWAPPGVTRACEVGDGCTCREEM